MRSQYPGLPTGKSDDDLRLERDEKLKDLLELAFGLDRVSILLVLDSSDPEGALTRELVWTLGRRDGAR